jgi:hypothetical protein
MAGCDARLFPDVAIPLLSGRDFDENDLQRRESVVIIDQAMATRLFPGQDPLGETDPRL